MRKNWIDIAKGIAILLVCAGHTRIAENAYGGSLIYACHMPCFFVLAGYCFDARKNDQLSCWAYILKKIKSLAFPYFTLVIVIAATMSLFGGGTWNGFIWGAFKSYPGDHTIGFWFVRVLFVVEVVYGIARIRFLRHVIGALGLVMAVLVSRYALPAQEDIVRPYSVLLALLFYHAGTLLRFVDLEKLSTMKKNVGMACCACSYLMLLFVSEWPVPCFGTAEPRTSALVFIAAALSGTFAIVGASFCFEKAGAIGKMLAWCGRNSLILLAFQPTCGMLRKIWLQKCDWVNGPLSYLLEFALMGFLLYIFS